MNDSRYVIGVIAAMGLVTFGLRALPFVAADWLQKHPVVHRLGQFLPMAIMTLLLVHSVVGTSTAHPDGPWPELVSVAIVMVLQWWRGNALLSILVGTALYVVARNMSF